MKVFDLTIPERGETPVLVEVPHAGLTIPESVRSEIAATQDAVQRDADIYVDKLYKDAPEQGAVLLSANVSRYVVDLNRAPDDVDRSACPEHPSPRGTQPRGVIWSMTTDGRPALTAPLSYAQLTSRLALFHTPYHATLVRELERLRERFGYVILLAAHSMPSVGRSGHTDPGARRADVVPGTQGRTTADARVIDLVDSHFRAAGLSVLHDDPYKGGFTTQYYGRPAEHQHAIQIELNRGLYVNEATGEQRTGDFERLQKLLSDLVHKLGRLKLA